MGRRIQSDTLYKTYLRKKSVSRGISYGLNQTSVYRTALRDRVFNGTISDSNSESQYNMITYFPFRRRETKKFTIYNSDQCLTPTVTYLGTNNISTLHFDKYLQIDYSNCSNGAFNYRQVSTVSTIRHLNFECCTYLQL